MKAETAQTEPISGLPSDFDVRVEVAERLAYINQFVNFCENPGMLKWVRNQVAGPYTVIQKRLAEMGEIPDTSKKANNA